MEVKTESYGVEMGDGSYEWYQDYHVAMRFSEWPRIDKEMNPTGAIVQRVVHTTITDHVVKDRKEVTDGLL